jgi:hypothetical protein
MHVRGWIAHADLENGRLFEKRERFEIKVVCHGR